jgi:hypothetical protein
MPPCWISAAVCSQAVHVPSQALQIPTTGAGGFCLALLIVAGVLLMLAGAALILLWARADRIFAQLEQRAVKQLRERVEEIRRGY